MKKWFLSYWIMSPTPPSIILLSHVWFSTLERKGGERRVLLSLEWQHLWFTMSRQQCQENSAKPLQWVNHACLLHCFPTIHPVLKKKNKQTPFSRDTFMPEVHPYCSQSSLKSIQKINTAGRIFERRRFVWQQLHLISKPQFSPWHSSTTTDRLFWQQQ